MDEDTKDLLELSGTYQFNSMEINRVIYEELDNCMNILDYLKDPLIYCVDKPKMAIGLYWLGLAVYNFTERDDVFSCAEIIEQNHDTIILVAPELPLPPEASHRKYHIFEDEFKQYLKEHGIH
jgi:hypothetical protein